MPMSGPLPMRGSCRNGATLKWQRKTIKAESPGQGCAHKYAEEHSRGPVRSLLFGPSILGFAGLGGVTRQKHKAAEQNSFCQGHIMSSRKVLVPRMQT